MKLTKFTKRDHSNERPFGAFFGQTSSSLLTIQHLWVSLFLTPALIATSILSKDVVIMVANMLLSLGYLSNLAYRIYHRQISHTELFITSLCLAALVGVTIYFAPAFGLVGALAVIAKLNLVATSINGFFLIKNIIVPPIKKWIDKLLLKWGVRSRHDFYHQSPLKVGVHDHAIQHLVEANCQSDTSRVHDNSDPRLKAFNNLIKVLSSYMNKYYSQFLGNLRKSSDLNALEGKINEVACEGRAGNAYIFIRKKLSYKNTKLFKLNEAKEAIIHEQEKDEPDEALLKKYLNYSKKERHSLTFFEDAIKLIDAEVARQEVKKEALENCIPQATM